MLMLLLLWFLAPVLMIALGCVGLMTIAIIVQGVRSIFWGED